MSIPILKKKQNHMTSSHTSHQHTKRLNQVHHQQKSIPTLVFKYGQPEHWAEIMGKCISHNRYPIHLICEIKFWYFTGHRAIFCMAFSQKASRNDRFDAFWQTYKNNINKITFDWNFFVVLFKTFEYYIFPLTSLNAVF